MQVFPSILPDGDSSDNSTDDSDADSGICGAELTSGGTCERPAGGCPYHGGGN